MLNAFINTNTRNMRNKSGPEPKQYRFETPTNPEAFPICFEHLIRTEADGGATIDLAVEEIRRQGWCLVNIDPRSQPQDYAWTTNNFHTTVEGLLQTYQTFFAQEEDVKSKYSCPESFGYNSTPVRQGMRVITGTNARVFHAPMSTEMASFDQTMLLLLENLSPKLFSCDSQTALTKTESCLAGSNPYGMLDIVRYHNNPSTNIHELESNVPGHNDPGILSFSMTSTETGLQLLDPTSDTWIDCPLDVGVIWLGNAARQLNPDLTAARHRVLFSDKARMSMWYEICTIHQVPNVIHENGMVPVEEEKEMFETIAVEMDGSGQDTFSLFVRSTGKNDRYSSKRIRLDNLTASSTIEDALRMFEYRTGNPRSKSMMMTKHNPTLLEIGTRLAVYDRNKTLGQCGLKDGDTVYMDWDQRLF